MNDEVFSQDTSDLYSEDWQEKNWISPCYNLKCLGSTTG